MSEESDMRAELVELRAEVQGYKSALRTIYNYCTAPHWNTERKYKIRDLVRATLKGETL
jgi:hypothetical protein